MVVFRAEGARNSFGVNRLIGNTIISMESYVIFLSCLELHGSSYKVYKHQVITPIEEGD